MLTPYKKIQRSALSLAILLSLPQLAQAVDGEWFELGDLPGVTKTGTQAYAISADGSTVVGYSANQVFRWTSAGMQDLNTLGRYSGVKAVSADGSAVVGTRYDEASRQQAFRWTSAGMQDLGTLGGGYSEASGISADGSVVVGASQTPTSRHAFRWTADNGMQDLGALGGTTDARAVSADGSVVLGTGRIGERQDGSRDYVFVWTAENGMVDIGSLGGGYSRAGLLSADGSTVTGGSANQNNKRRAFRWTAESGMADIGTLDYEGSRSIATAISADGSVIAGYGTTYRSSATENRLPTHAFRWTIDNGMQDLGTLGGESSKAVAMSADGSVVVGDIYTTGVPRFSAFRWSEAEGMQSIADWVGVSGPSYEISQVVGVSADGQAVLGIGYAIPVLPSNEWGLSYPEFYNPRHTWIARKGGIINPEQWLQSLNVSQQIYQAGEYLSSLALDGSHHRPLALYANTTESNSCVWANGDVGNYGYGRDATAGLAEVGVCGSSGGLTFGGSVGNAWQNQNFDYDGNLDVDGQFFTGEVNWQVPDSPLLLSALAMYGSYSADIKRGYANGADEIISKGNTDMHTSTLRLRADWLDAFSVAEVSLSPWTSVTATRTEVDAYTETSGPFPASFDSQDETAKEARLGLTGRYALTATTTLLGTVETVHNMDDQGPNLSGEGIGLFGFDQSGQAAERNWQRVGVEVDQLVGKAGLISFSLYGANEGQDANGSLAVKYIHRF